MHMRELRNAAKNNRQNIKADTECGCYYCCTVFAGIDIVEWADLNGTTAICPICHIDSVVPGVTDAETLDKAHRYWFRLSAT